MDFVNAAAVEYVGAIEAQREHERRERKWLRAWRQLEREGLDASAPIRLPSRVPDEQEAETRAA
jgi:hypothetical protein